MLSTVRLPTDVLLCKKHDCYQHNSDLEVYYLQLINCLQTAADKAVHRVKINFQKHWWSEELDQLKQQCIEVTNFWRDAGCPRSGDINTNRIRAKLKYKNAVKLAAKRAETDLNDSLLDQLCSKDNESYWKAWRKRCCLNKLKPTQIINGKTGNDNILKEFSSCYQNIYQPNTLGLDSQFADRVKVLLDDRRQCESDADSSRSGPCHRH